MVSTETIRTLTIRGRTEGLSQVSGELNAVDAAQRKVAVSGEIVATATETSSRRQLSAARSFESLRTRLDDTYRSQQLYAKAQAVADRALAQGITTAVEHARVIDQARTRYLAASSANEAMARSTGLAAHEVTNLGRQFADIATMAAMGASPFQIISSQGAQVADVFMNTRGTARGMFDQITAGARAVLTPTRLVAGGVLAIGSAALVAASQWSRAQREMSMALTGAGRATGATVGGLNRAANDNASMFGLSVSEARNLATQLAATGKIGAEAISPIVGLGRDFAKVFGVDAAEAAKMLAEAFSDPVRGAEQLNQRLGFLDAATERQIQNLSAQNRIFEAQQLVYGRVKSALTGMTSVVSTSADIWTALSNAVSNAWDAFGKFSSRVTGIGFIEGLDEKIEQSKQKIEEWQKTLASNDRYASYLRSVGATEERIALLVPALGRARVELEKEQQNLEQLNKKWNDNEKAVRAAQEQRDSIANAALVRKVLPELDQRNAMENTYEGLSRILEKVGATGGAASPLLRAMEISLEQLAKAADIAKGSLDGFRSESERTRAELRLQIEAVSARSPTDRGDIAYRQSLLQRGSTSEDAKAEAALVRDLAIKQAQQGITDAMNARLLSAQQNVETVRLELDLLGRSVGEQERMRGAVQIRQQLEQEALQTLGNRDAYDRKHLATLLAQNEQIARSRQLLAEQQLASDAGFETKTLGLSSTDQQIASRLRAIYGDNGWSSRMNGDIASTMRWNEALKSVSSTLESELTTGLTDALDGTKSFGEAMSSMSDTVVRALEEMIVKMYVIGPLMRSMQGMLGGGSGFGGLGSLFASANGNVFAGGNVVPFARGGIVDRPTIFPMSRGMGLMGEAGAEAVMPLRRTSDGRLGVAASGAAATPTVNVNVSNNHDGADVSVGRASYGADGSINLDIVIDRINARIADQTAAGRGAMAKVVRRRSQLRG